MVDNIEIDYDAIDKEIQQEMEQLEKEEKEKAAALAKEKVPVQAAQPAQPAQPPVESLAPSPAAVHDPIPVVHDIARDPLASQEEKPKKQRLTAKQVLINDLIKLATETKSDIPKEEDLKLLKVVDLRKLMASIVEKKTKEVMNTTELGKKDSELSEYGVNAMYNLNKIIVSLAEFTSKKFEDKIGASLEGWNDSIDKDKEELKGILRRVWGEYGKSIEPFMSPLAVYGMFMLRTANAQLLENIKKKWTTTSKEASKEPKPGSPS